MFDRTTYNQNYYQKNKAKRAAYAREWRSKNPDKVKEANHKQYLKRKEAERERTAVDTSEPV